MLGNEGDDWLETGTFDGAPGDNFDEIFAHDGIRGNDVFLGDGGFDEFIGEGGDDIFVGSPGRGKMAGMSGFDWATYKDNADLRERRPVRRASSSTKLRRFRRTRRSTSSSRCRVCRAPRFNDILKGSERRRHDACCRSRRAAPTGYLGSALDAQGIALIAGLQAVLGAGVTSFAAGDIILGGDGSDLIRAMAATTSSTATSGSTSRSALFARPAMRDSHRATPIRRCINSMTTLTSAWMFAGTINPGQLAIVRTIRTDTTAGDIDTAAYPGQPLRICLRRHCGRAGS